MKRFLSISSFSICLGVGCVVLTMLAVARMHYYRLEAVVIGGSVAFLLIEQGLSSLILENREKIDAIRIPRPLDRYIYFLSTFSSFALAYLLGWLIAPSKNLLLWIAVAIVEALLASVVITRWNDWLQAHAYGYQGEMKKWNWRGLRCTASSLGIVLAVCAFSLLVRQAKALLIFVGVLGCGLLCMVGFSLFLADNQELLSKRGKEI